MKDAMLDAALAYVRERGWPVFPVAADKTPLTPKGCLDATTDPAKIKAFWRQNPGANIGLHVGDAGLMALDYDPGSDRATAERACDGLPATKLRSRTPRGGWHEFYALAPGEVVSNSASKIAPSVDVRSWHGYVLLPPSRTGDGAYSWVDNGQPAFRSDGMLRVCNSAREKSAERDTWSIEPDLPENQALCVDWLKHKAKIAVQGQGGDQMAYDTAAMCKSYGISRELASTLMLEHWNPRNNPPWSGDELGHFEAKIDHAYAYNTSPPGNMTPAYKAAVTQALFKPVPQPLPSGRSVTSGRFRFVDNEGMAHIPPVQWLIDGLLTREGYAILFGAPGTFKTFVALDMALSVATHGRIDGGTWPKVVHGGPVLYCAGEGRSGIAARVHAWRTKYFGGQAIPNFILGDPVPHVDEDLTPFANGALALSPEGYRLVVIDTIGRAMQGVNENAQEHASKLTLMVERLRQSLGCAVLALHHVRKEDGGIRGSGAFQGDADTLLKLDRPNKAFIVTITVEKQKDAPEAEPQALKLVEIENSLAVERSDAPAPKRETPADRKRREGRPANGETLASTGLVFVLDKAIVEVLKAHPAKVWSQRQLADALAMHPRIDASSSSLRQRHMTTLRETKGTAAHKLYDPVSGQWRIGNWVANDLQQVD